MGNTPWATSPRHLLLSLHGAVRNCAHRTCMAADATAASVPAAYAASSGGGAATAGSPRGSAEYHTGCPSSACSGGSPTGGAAPLPLHCTYMTCARPCPARVRGVGLSIVKLIGAL